MNIDRRFASTEFVVEATSFEVLTLWRTRELPWVQDTSGLHVEVGSLDNRPVIISVQWEIINDHRILFWEAVSEVVDLAQINAWLDANCAPRWDNGTRLARCNAMNFHLALEVCR